MLCLGVTSFAHVSKSIPLQQLTDKYRHGSVTLLVWLKINVQDGDAFWALQSNRNCFHGEKLKTIPRLWAQTFTKTSIPTCNDTFIHWCKQCAGLDLFNKNSRILSVLWTVDASETPVSHSLWPNKTKCGSLCLQRPWVCLLFGKNILVRFNWHDHRRRGSQQILFQAFISLRPG